MIELFIMILAYINIIDASTNGQIHVDGMVDDNNVTVQLFGTYKVMKILHTNPNPMAGTPDECKLHGCPYFIEQTELLASTRSTNDGSFTLSAYPRQITSQSIPQYSLLVNGHEENIKLIHSGLRDLIRSTVKCTIDQCENYEMTREEFGIKLVQIANINNAQNVEFPEWFETVAVYWADKQISNADLVNAVDWLVSHEIITYD